MLDAQSHKTLYLTEIKHTYKNQGGVELPCKNIRQQMPINF